MDFDFSDDQKTMKEQAHRFLSEKCPPTVARAVLENDSNYDESLWKQIAEMGWLGTAIPEEYGGIGLGHAELCVLAEEMGRALAPVPFSSSIYLCAEAILLAGSEEQKTEWLPKLASGEVIGTFALAEGAKAPSPKTIRTRYENGALNGTKTPVADGMIADIAVVACKSGSGISLALVDLSDGAVTPEKVTSIDPSRGHAGLTFKDAKASQLGDDGAWLGSSTAGSRPGSSDDGV